MIGMLPLSRRTARTLSTGALALLLGAGAGGCNNALQQENADLLAENSELRERNAQLESSLGNTESQKAALQGEIDRLRADLSARGTQTTARGAGSGFDGMGEGVTVGSRGGDIVVGVAGDVLFDSGKATLKSSARRTLDNIASVLQSRYAGKTIRVEGYTDSDPIRRSNWKTNERLSSERALAVEEYLVQRGVNNNSIYAAAFGPANPRGNKAQSRRVEIVILENAR